MKDILLGLRDALLITIVIQIMAFTFIKTFKELGTVRSNVQKIVSGR
jgi:hypothetical protein